MGLIAEKGPPLTGRAAVADAPSRHSMGAFTGGFALAALVAAGALIALTTAAAPSPAVANASARFFPGWLAGPLHPIGLNGSTSLLVALVVAACGCYLVMLRCASALDVRWLWT